MNPARLPGNDYRDYTEQDIRTLRFIRMLRMLDVPASGHPVRAGGRCTAGEYSAGAADRTGTARKAAGRGGAVFAPNWPGRTRLRRRWMWTPACPGWKIPRSRRRFSPAGCRITARWRRCSIRSTFFFIPQGSINTPQEFTAALQAYAEERGMQLSLIKEGMYPEFSLDGISYKAYRNPGKYRDEVCCDAVHPEQLNTGLPSAAGNGSCGSCGSFCLRHAPLPAS